MRFDERTGSATRILIGMKVNLTYRVTIQPSGRVLRVRIRREDGLSIVLLFRDPGHFEAVAQQANLSVTALQALEDDVAVLAQMRESSFARGDLEIGPEELQRLGATEWSDPKEFNLSFERTSGGRTAYHGTRGLSSRRLDVPERPSCDAQGTASELYVQDKHASKRSS